MNNTKCYAVRERDRVYMRVFHFPLSNHILTSTLYNSCANCKCYFFDMLIILEAISYYTRTVYIKVKPYSGAVLCMACFYFNLILTIVNAGPTKTNPEARKAIRSRTRSGTMMYTYSKKTKSVKGCFDQYCSVKHPLIYCGTL